MLKPSAWYDGGRAFGSCLDHDDGVLMNGFSALIKGAPERDSYVESKWKDGTLQPGESPPQDQATLAPWSWFPALNVLKSKLLLFLGH